MPIKKVRKKYFFVRRRTKKWMGLLLISIVSVFGAYSINKLLNATPDNTTLKLTMVGDSIPDAQFLTAQYERTVYPYSVIPGGVHSREELSANIRNDSIVSEHYADFDVARAQLVNARETRFMYVSYRLKNKIYWTSKKIRIPQGETLITDGSCEARTRCGNMVSATPMTPVSDAEPDVEVFDVPQLAQLGLPQLEPLFEPGLPPLMLIPAPDNLPGLPPTIVPSIPPVLSWTPKYPLVVDPPGDPRNTPPTGPAVPEPSTMVLMLTGLAVTAIIGIRRNK